MVIVLVAKRVVEILLWTLLFVGCVDRSMT